MYYLNSRYYNPQTGRFISSDGLIGTNGDVLSTNMYSYGENNPIIYVDPTGYVGWSIFRGDNAWQEISNLFSLVFSGLSISFVLIKSLAAGILACETGIGILVAFLAALGLGCSLAMVAWDTSFLIAAIVLTVQYGGFKEKSWVFFGVGFFIVAKI